MSDGSAQLYFVSPKTFTVVRSVTVRLGGKSVNYLNELEWIDGKIWANVYTKDDIMIIDPATGVVEGVIDCRGLLPKGLRSERTDVLNGIACHPDSGDIFLTGKYWPRMYKVSLVEKK
jgi:glutamine cyclotransferase